MSSIEFADNKPLTPEEIRQAAASQLRSSLMWTDDTLHRNWELAYRYYKGEAPSAQSSQTSTIVSTDMSDTVEWMLPAVLKPLVESPDVVRFDPVNPEDQEQADTESDYVHHTLMKKCDGFLKLYNHIKDALILKNSVFCTYWDKGVINRKETYRDMTEIELVDLLNPADDSEIRVLAQSSREEPVKDPMTGRPIPDTKQTLYDLTIRRFTTRGRPIVENCKPEAFGVAMSHDSLNLEDARYCRYTMRKTRAELLADGYSPTLIDEIPKGASRYWDNSVRWEREDVERSDNQIGAWENETGDPSQDQFDVIRVYITLDADGDGFEEKYLVVLGGRNGQVLLDHYEVPENPFSASSPFIAAHKFYGYSLYDKLKNLTDHKTKVLRMLEDNMDLVNNPRKKVVRGQADLDDLLITQVGGLWRVDDQDAVQEVPTPSIQSHAQQLLDYYDKMRAERTGIDPNAQSVSQIMPEESMNHAMERVISMKEELVGLVIRVFTEAGIKSMMHKLRNLMIRYRPQQELVQLRNKWVTINPGNWIERTNTTVVVGLGTGDKLRKGQGLAQVFQMQQQAVQGGLMGILVSPERVRHTASEMVRVWGLGDPDDFFLSPTLLDDPRNQTTPRAQETFRALQLRQQQAQEAQAAQQAQQEAQAAQQQMLLEFNKQIEEVRSHTKLLEAQLKAQTEDKNRSVDVMKFMEEERRKWAELRAEETAEEDKLVIEATKAAIQERAASQQTQLQPEGSPE